MNTDIRLSTGFWQHPKTKKTAKRLGLEGVRSLQVLWLWVAQHRPDGNLYDLDWEEIELAADWNGEERAFFDLCLGMWIDETPEGYALHDWREHNPWQADAEARSDKAKKAAQARWGKAQPDNEQCLDDAQALLGHDSSNAPLPSPSPEELRESSLRSDSLSEASAPDQLTDKPEGDPPPQPKPKPKPKAKPKPELAEDSIAFRLARLMRDELTTALPTLKEPNLQNWARDFDVALRNDKRMDNPNFVAAVIRWVANDDFWRTNCQCPATLRKQFDKLTARMEAEARRARDGPQGRIGMSAQGNTTPDGQRRVYEQDELPGWAKQAAEQVTENAH